MITETVDDAGICELVVHNPPVNAFSIADLDTMTDHFRSYASRPEVNVVILRSEGKGFCGGGDLKEVQGLPGFEGILGQGRGSFMSSLTAGECAVPVVAAIHRYCIGVGVLIAGMCDVIFSTPDTRFILAEVDNGAASGGIQAIGLMPEKRLRAAMFTAEPVMSEELHHYGSVYKLVEEDQLLDEVRAFAAVIAAKRPRIVRALKTSMNNSIGRDLRTLYRQEMSYTYELNLLGDAREARGDFVEGRRKGYESE